jgi:integrase
MGGKMGIRDMFRKRIVNIPIIESIANEKFKLELKLTDKPGIYSGTKRNGQKYSVRADRHRYFFPGEWERFISQFDNQKHKLLFLSLVHSGARIMEALHLKSKNFDFERETITFEVTKQRKAKKQFQAVAKSRTFFVSPIYLKAVKSYINKNNLQPEEYLFLDNEKLPANYNLLNNVEKKLYYRAEVTAYRSLFKRKLKRAKIEDYYNFSLHNIRKTYAAYMRIYNIRSDELCYRMGHDMQTFMAHYGSSLIFTTGERQIILRLFGENVK